MAAARTGSLNDRVAVVVGASRRAGRLAALGLAEDGAHVVVTANQSGDEIEAVADAIRRRGGTALPIVFDITDEAAVASAFACIERELGRVDILINNAAIRRQCTFLKMSLQEWRNIMSVNLDGVFLCCREALPLMLRNGGGRIINIGGITAHVGVKNRAHVAASKAAILGLTKALAIEFAQHKVTVNCIAPGQIGGQRSATAGKSPIDVSRIPLGREGTIEDVAAAIRYLCQPDAGFVTGQTLHVNGGLFMP